MKPAQVLTYVGAGVLVSLLGCWGLMQTLPAAGSGNMAVIDLNRVAKLLGRDQQITEAIQSSNAALGQQLADFQSQLQQKYTEQKSQQENANVEGANKQGVQLAGYEQALNQQLSKAQRVAQQTLLDQRRELVRKFRDEVSPVASRIARERGLSAVVVKTDVLLTHESQIDISDEVAKRLSAAAPAAPAKVANEPPPPAK